MTVMPDPAEQGPNARSVAEIEPVFTLQDWCESILQYGEVKAFDEPKDVNKPWHGQEVLGITWGPGASPIEYKLCRLDMPGSDRWLPYTLYMLNIHPRPHSPALLMGFHYHADTGRTYKHDGGGKWAERNGERDYVGLNDEMLGHLRTAPEQWWPHNNTQRLSDHAIATTFVTITTALTEAQPPRLRRSSRLLRCLGIGAP